MAQTGVDLPSNIAARTRDFTGREWVVAKIDHCLPDLQQVKGQA